MIAEASEQPARESGRLGHEVHATLDDDLLPHLRGLARKLKRVAADVGHAMKDFGRLIIMRENDGIAFLLQVVDRLHIGRH